MRTSPPWRRCSPRRHSHLVREYTPALLPNLGSQPADGGVKYTTTLYGVESKNSPCGSYTDPSQSPTRVFEESPRQNANHKQPDGLPPRIPRSSPSRPNGNRGRCLLCMYAAPPRPSIRASHHDLKLTLIPRAEKLPRYCSSVQPYGIFRLQIGRWPDERGPRDESRLLLPTSPTHPF